jgi:hypothetical protein
MNKLLTTLLAVVFVMFLSVSSSTAAVSIPEKYNLNTQLEQVHHFWKTSIMDWEAIDNQSLVIEVSPGTYYLIVLTIPSYNLPFKMNRIGITSSGSMVREGTDNVVVSGAGHYRQNFPIERIYKISGSKQMREIVEQLQARQGETHKY